MSNSEKYITLDDDKYFEKVTTEHGIAYICKNYQGPIALNATVAKVENDTSH